MLPNQINFKLDELEICKGDSIFIHSNLSFTGTINRHNYISYSRNLIELLQVRLGNTGQIFLPAFSYSFGRGEIYSAPSFESLSQMGVLSQVALDLKFKSSFDPLFAVLGWGREIDILFKRSIEASNGENSIFRRLIEQNTKIINIAVGTGCTLIHEIEYILKVPYRYMKNFSGVCADHNPKYLNWSAFVRKLDYPGSQSDFTRLNNDFPNSTYLTSTKFGRSYILTYKIKDLWRYLENKLSENPSYLIQGNKNFKI